MVADVDRPVRAFRVHPPDLCPPRYPGDVSTDGYAPGTDRSGANIRLPAGKRNALDDVLVHPALSGVPLLH